MTRNIPILVAALCVLSSCSMSGESREDVPFAEASSSRQRHPLFRVTKSENANYVKYDLLLAGADRFADDPLDVYWIIETAEGKEEGLNSFEVDLYGITIVKVLPGSLDFRINGVESKVFDVTLASDSGVIQTCTTIDGQRAMLTAIHLVITSTWNPFNPNVEVQLTGTSLEDQRRVTETIGN